MQICRTIDGLCIFMKSRKSSFFFSFFFFFHTRNISAKNRGGLRKHEIFPISLSNLFSSISNLTSRQSLAALRYFKFLGEEKRERERKAFSLSLSLVFSSAAPINSPFLPSRVNFNQTSKMETRERERKKREGFGFSKKRAISEPSSLATTSVEFAFHYNLCMRLTWPADYLRKTGLNNTVNWPPLLLIWTD